MTVILATGPTGGGKSALVVAKLAFGDEFKNRPLFVMGIPELKLDHQPTPPVEEWTEMRPSPEDPTLLLPYFTFPPNAVVVIDECQRVYRPRPTGSKVPNFVAAFETHRHTGVDFILITQHPSLIDSNVRKLVRRHWHIYEHAFGRDLLEWPRLGEVENRVDRELARREKYKPDPRAFPLYKSAEAHTVIPRKLPKYVYLFAVCCVLFVALAGYAYHRISSRMSAPEVAAAPKDSHLVPLASPSPGVSGSANGERYVVKSLLDFQSVNPEHPEFAPAFESLRVVKSMPVVAGCVVTKRACRCYTLQGSRVEMARESCEAWIDSPPFDPWRDPRPELVMASGNSVPVMLPAPGAPVSLPASLPNPGPSLALAPGAADALPPARVVRAPGGRMMAP